MVVVVSNQRCPRNPSLSGILSTVDLGHGREYVGQGYCNEAHLFCEKSRWSICHCIDPSRLTNDLDMRILCPLHSHLE